MISPRNWLSGDWRAPTIAELKEKYGKLPDGPIPYCLKCKAILLQGNTILPIGPPAVMYEADYDC